MSSSHKIRSLSVGAAVLMGLVVLQYGLGVYTLLEQVPIVPAVMHQALSLIHI